jgi:predicted MFS family arabinose efflux permease
MLSTLRHPTFRLLFAAQVTSLLGTGLTTIALALLAYDLAGGDAGFVLGMMLALKMVIYVVLAPVIEAFVARLDRRRLLIVLDLARAVIVLGLPFASEIWHVYALFLALHVCAAGFTPAFQATIPRVLPDETQYTQALAVSRLAYDIENLASPSLAALALVFVSYDLLFVANAATFAASAGLIVATRLPGADGEDPLPFVSRATRGLTVFLATPRLRGLFALYLAVAAGGSMAIVNTVVLVRDRFGGGESEVAVLMAAMGGGSMLAAFSLPRLIARLGDRTVMLAGGVGQIAGLAVAMALGTETATAVGWVVIGFTGTLVTTPAGRLIIRSAEPSAHASLFAAQFALSHLCWLVAYPVAGVLGRLDEVWVAFTVLALLASVGTGLAAWLWPRE